MDTFIPAPPTRQNGIEPCYLAEEEAAIRFSVSTKTLSRRRELGLVRAFAYGGKLIRHRVSDLDAFVDAHSTGGDGSAPARCTSKRAYQRRR